MATYTADGQFDCGSPVAVNDADAVAEVVRRVIATGQAETLTIGASAPRIVPAKATKMQHCSYYTQDQGCPLHGELCAH